MLLQTKIRAAPLPTAHVPRPALCARMDGALSVRLSLVSAPPGYGKTTLLTEWLTWLSRWPAAERPAVAWLSLDAGDNDLARFLRYLLAALETAMPGCAADARSILDAPQLPDTETLLAPILNELAAQPVHLLLVLDDYHVIEARPVHDALMFLLDNMPPRAHLVLATRADPPLPMAKLRVRRQLLEVRASELRFDEAAAGALLQSVLGGALTPSDVSALQARTEGWAAGLQMAGLSLQGQGSDASARFVAAFSGSHAYLVDYLTEEVLSRQPADVQAFLLHTAVLARLCAPLCAAVMPGLDEGQAQEMLERLARANLFLTPLDEERRWFRYHSLFADLLVARLRRTAGFRQTHARSAAWLAANGHIEDAMGHALAAGEYALASDLIEAHWASTVYRGEVSTVLRWMEALPSGMVQANAHLGAAFCWVLLYRGEIARLAPHLAAAEAAAERDEGTATLHGEARALLYALRSNLARLAPGAGQAEMLEASRLAEAGVAAAPAGSVGRAAALVSLGQALRDLDLPAPAIAAYEAALPLLRRQGNLLVAAGTVYNMARLLPQAGHLYEAFRLCSEALTEAEVDQAGDSPAAGQVHLALAGLLTERGALVEAEAHLVRGEALVQRGGQLDLLRLAQLARARLKLAQGDVAGALAAASDAERIARQVGAPGLLREASAVRATMAARAGQTAEARRWFADLLAPLTVAEDLAAAHVLYLTDGAPAALEMLEGTLRTLESEGREGALIAGLALAALCHDALGQAGEAFTSLARALRLAEPEGYARVFLDEGLSMLALLRQAAARGIQPGYVAALLSLAGASPQALAALAATPPAAAVGGPPLSLLEPLSKRELEVLRLLAGYLSNTQIAGRLTVSVGTVKTHIHHIYGKLGVTGRAEAIERARQLRLI